MPVTQLLSTCGMNHGDRPAMFRLPQALRAEASFFRFLGIGASVAMIDMGLLLLLHSLAGMHLYAARVFSFTAAIGASYLLNRRYNFRHCPRCRHTVHDVARFYGAHALGNAINYAVFVGLLEGFREIGLQPAGHAGLLLLAIWLGGVVGVSANFMLSRQLVFDR
ncbi:GtrA family protein [Thioalkalivibrio sp.]|uniref:GtrA family protein n=1 Tax=Thioalkalivibrio sp. TaxID=2093813 RepID=UPI003564E1A1